MTLSEELLWRGFTNQTTYKDYQALDGPPISFYWGVDPSADSMTIGNLAAAMMVRHFIDHGHKAYLLVGGATGLIGDPDGKKQERDLQTIETIALNKEKIARQYKTIFAGQDFQIVDNYDWFKDMNYLEFLRAVGKNIPLSQMLGRDFVQSRLGEDGAGISYAEFSYSLIQGYDFLHLYREHEVSLQLCGADQWGNSIAGVDLIRRVTGGEAHVWSTPLVVNKTTGVKFGKSEEGAVWLDASKTSPTKFYQFWINCDDAGVSDYLKIFTFLSKDQVEAIMKEQAANPGSRPAQTLLAQEVTRLIHGEEALAVAQDVTGVLTGKQSLDALDESALSALSQEIPYALGSSGASVSSLLVETSLATSLSEAHRLLEANAISINGQKITHEQLSEGDFINGMLLIRRGKAFKDSALVKRA